MSFGEIGRLTQKTIQEAEATNKYSDKDISWMYRTMKSDDVHHCARHRGVQTYLRHTNAYRSPYYHHNMHIIKAHGSPYAGRANNAARHQWDEGQSVYGSGSYYIG